MQGAADLVMGVAAAAAGALAGFIVGALGYAALNLFAAILAPGWPRGRRSRRRRTAVRSATGDARCAP